MIRRVEPVVSESERSERRCGTQPRPEELGSLRRGRAYPGDDPGEAAGDPLAAMGDFGEAREGDKKECGHGTNNAYKGAPTLSGPTTVSLSHFAPETI
jgi:hypothetical protein